MTDLPMRAALSSTPELADVATTSHSVDAYLSREYPLLFPTRPPVEPAEPECRIPGCSGSWHDDDICDVVLADLATPGTALIAEVSVGATVPAELVVWEAEDGRNLLRTNDRGAGHAFAAKLRELADAIEQGAQLLAPAADEMAVAA